MKTRGDSCVGLDELTRSLFMGGGVLMEDAHGGRRPFHQANIDDRESETVAWIDRPISFQIADILCRDTFSRDSREVYLYIYKSLYAQLCTHSYVYE